MTRAERTEILAVVAILEKSKDLLRSRMLGEARGRLQALVADDFDPDDFAHAEGECEICDEPRDSEKLR